MRGGLKTFMLLQGNIFCCGVFVAIPGDTIHAGGFCFGRKLTCPIKRNQKKNKERYFQN